MDQQVAINHPAPAPRVLIVDDDPGVADVLSSIAEETGCMVKSLLDGGKIVGMQDTFDPDVIFMDLFMPGVNGIDAIHMLGEGKSRAKLVLISGLERRTLASAKKVATNCGLDVIGVLEKPFDVDNIAGLLQPFVDRMKNDDAELCQRTEAPGSLGPVLFFEMIKSLTAFDSSRDRCFRLSGKWRLDSGEYRAMGCLVNSAHQDSTALGLIELEFRLLKLELLRLSPSLTEGLQFVLPISANTLLSDSFSEILNRGINIAGLGPNAVCLEILDIENVRDWKVVLENLTKLDVMGFKLSYCISAQPDRALSCIKELPLDDVVFDFSVPAFTERDLDDQETHFEYGSLVSFAAKEGLSVSAKNVRIAEHFQFASRCGIVRISGDVIHQSANNLAEALFYSEDRKESSETITSEVSNEVTLS